MRRASAWLLLVLRSSPAYHRLLCGYADARLERNLSGRKLVLLVLVSTATLSLPCDKRFALRSKVLQSTS